MPSSLYHTVHCTAAADGACRCPGQSQVPLDAHPVLQLMPPAPRLHWRQGPDISVETRSSPTGLQRHIIIPSPVPSVKGRQARGSLSLSQSPTPQLFPVGQRPPTSELGQQHPPTAPHSHPAPRMCGCLPHDAQPPVQVTLHIIQLLRRSLPWLCLKSDAWKSCDFAMGQIRSSLSNIFIK